MMTKGRLNKMETVYKYLERVEKILIELGDSKDQYSHQGRMALDTLPEIQNVMGTYVEILKRGGIDVYK